MNLHTFAKKIYQACWFSSVSILTACGGGEGDSAPMITNEAPTVAITSANRAIEKELVYMVAQASDIDGSISQYRWSINNAEIKLNGSDTVNLSFIAPSVEENTDYIVTLTVTDNSGASASTSLTFTSEPIVKTLILAGQVIDEEIVNATVVVEVGDEFFTGFANAMGGYSLELTVDERNFEQLIKITAYGHPDYHPDTKLISLLPSFNTVLAQANAFNFVSIVENFALNVTNVTTAKYLLARQNNKNQTITSLANYDEIYSQFLMGNITPELYQQVMEIAAVLKVVIDGDYDEYTLPEGAADTYEMISNANFYSQMVTRIDVQVLNDTMKLVNGDSAITEFPDLDGDGEIDEIDADMDGDGVVDFDDKGNVIDYFPRDSQEWAPRLRQLVFVDDEPESESYISYLRSCLKNIIGGTSTWQEESVLSFTELDCRHWPAVGDISVLAYFTNLTELHLSDTQVEDISMLGNLTKLTKLSLEGTKVSDFSIVAKMPLLTTLDLDYSNFSDLTLIEHATQLESLSLRASLITTLSIKDLSLANYFPNLTSLDIANTAISYLSPVAGLKNLETLISHDSEVSSLFDFTTTPKLNHISLYGNKIENIEPLAALINFNSLDLHNNVISSISALTGLTELTQLNLAGNKLTSINTLATLVNLTELNLAGEVNTSGEYMSNHFTDVSPLAALTKLVVLNINATGVSSLSALENSTKLNSLKAKNNQITNVDILLNSNTLPLELNLYANPLLCEDDILLAEKAAEQSINYTSSGDCLEKTIVTGGPFGVDMDGEFVAEQSLGQVFEVLGTYTQSYTWSDLGMKDRIMCFSGALYPICYEANLLNGEASLVKCVAPAESQQMICTPGNSTWQEVTYEGVPFTVDFDLSIQPNNAFITSFDSRILLNLVKVARQDVNIVCSPLNLNNESICRLTSEFFTGEINWLQDHDGEYYPRCNGVAGQSVATCTPAPSIVGGDENSAYSFMFDVSQHVITPNEARSIEEECPVGHVCTGNN